MADWKNKLFFGDNLDILREQVPDESVDLIYLDPPVQLQRHVQRAFPRDERREVCGADPSVRRHVALGHWIRAPLSRGGDGGAEEAGGPAAGDALISSAKMT